MHTHTLIAFISYFTVLFFIALASSWSRDKTDSAGLMLGNRSLNFWLTALSAHASDMSDWLFMGFPAVIFANGLPQAWIAIGLTVFMFLNWHFIAPKIRIETERYKAKTLSSYFENRLGDTSGSIKILSTVILMVFFTIYIAAGLVGIGFLFESAFNFSSLWGLIFAVCVVIAYTAIGGFVAVAWTDFFQAIFLLIMIILVPSVAYFKIGGFSAIKIAAVAKGAHLTLMPDYSMKSLIQGILLALGWGLGYFGMPHILNKFMGMKDPREAYKSKYIGITWQILSLSASIFVGLVGMALFKDGLVVDELIFVEMVKLLFSPLFGGFILCAIFAATISTIDSQVIVLASGLTEDFYKGIRPKAKDKELVWVYRLGIAVVCIASLLIALNSNSTILDLVFYAWTGLACSFGPLVVLSLHSDKINKYGAISGMIAAFLTVVSWKHYFSGFVAGYSVPAMIPGFFIGMLVIWGVSRITE